MPNLPAFCDNCGTIFPSGFLIDHASHVTLSGNKSGPCPKCGGMGSIPDGVFNFVGNVVEILSAPQVTLEKLQRLSQLASELKDKAVESTLEKIEKEFPELKETIENVRKDSGHIVTWLTLFFLAVQTVIQAAAYFADKSPSKNEIQNMIDSSIQKSFQQNQPGKPTFSPDSPKRIDPCPCGSGKRFKNCCGVFV